MKKLLKVIQLYTNESESKLIRKAKSNNREAQQAIYEKFSPKMLSVCRYYISDLQFAEDVMITAFFKVFTNLNSFKNNGSFEGWIRRIMIRESISFLRSYKQMVFIDENEIPDQEIVYDTNLETDEIQLLIDKLPNGYRTVFVMYVVEGFSHKEIAKTLHISESTSKTQLHKAKKMLQEKLKIMKLKSNGTK